MTGPRPLAPEVEQRLAELFAANISDRAAARRLQLHATTIARHRRRLGFPDYDPCTQATPEQMWAENVRHLDGGHVEWTGWRNEAGVPTLMYRQTRLSARKIAFRMRTDREPVGYVKPDCGEPWCVAPAHVDDRPGRAATATALRAIGGVL